MKKHFIYLITLCLICFLVYPLPKFAVAKGVLEITVAESEDRDFIRSMFEDKRYNFAREEANAYLLKYPKGAFRAEINFVLGQLEVIQERYPVALLHFNTVIHGYADSPYAEDAMFQSGVLLLKLGREKNGRSRLKELLRKHKKSRFKSKVYFELGQSAFKQKYWKIAEDRLLEALKKEDLTASLQLEAQNSLAWAFHFQGKKAEAKNHFETLLSSTMASQRKAKITYQLGVNWFLEEQYKPAIVWYERLIKDWPNSDFVEKSRYGIAESIYQIQQDPKLKISKKQRHRAIKIYTENLSKQTPIEPELSRYHRGWLYVSLEMQDLADQDFEYLQDHHRSYRSDRDLTLMRADYLEGKNEWSHAHRILIRSVDSLQNRGISTEIRLRIIANEFYRKDCKKVDHWNQDTKDKQLKKHWSQINYYIGKCHYSEKRLNLAKKAFKKIPLDSKYAPLFFKDYLKTFQKDKDLKGALGLLNEAVKYPKIGKKEDILLLKAELFLDFKQWADIFEPMKEIQKLSPHKIKEAWHLIILAKAHESLSDKRINATLKGKYSEVKSPSFHQDQALEYYQSAYNNLPEDDFENRLSLIETLVQKYKAKGIYEEVINLYKDAIKVIKKPSRIATLTLQIGKLYQTRLKQRNQAKIWFLKLHGKKDRQQNFEASTLLAEIQIGQKNYRDAIKILQVVSNQPIEATKWYPIIHFRLGELFQSQEKWEKALFEYKRVSSTSHKSKFKKQAKKRIKNIASYLKELKKIEIRKQNEAIGKNQIITR